MRLTWHVISRTDVRRRRMLAALPTHCQGSASAGAVLNVCCYCHFSSYWLGYFQEGYLNMRLSESSRGIGFTRTPFPSTRIMSPFGVVNIPLISILEGVLKTNWKTGIRSSLTTSRASVLTFRSQFTGRTTNSSFLISTGRCPVPSVITTSTYTLPFSAYMTGSTPMKLNGFQRCLSSSVTLDVAVLPPKNKVAVPTVSRKVGFSSCFSVVGFALSFQTRFCRYKQPPTISINVEGKKI